MIYFIQSDKHIKIGVASNIQDRMSSLQTGNPVQLELLCLIPGRYEVELYYHQKFNDSRFRGEWFYITEELLDTIDNLLEEFSDYMEIQIKIKPEKEKRAMVITTKNDTKKNLFYTLTQEDKVTMVTMATADVATKYNVSQRTAQRWVNKIQENK